MKNDSDKATISINTMDGVTQINCDGEWSLDHISSVERALSKLTHQLQQQSDLVVDITHVEKFDGAGVIMLLKFKREWLNKDCQFQLIGASDEQQRMLLMYESQLGADEDKKHHPLSLADKLERLGKKTINTLYGSAEFFSFIGETFQSFVHYLVHPSSIRFRAIVQNIEEAGVRALPIIALTSFLIGVVIAYQSAVQLEKFGASIFIVDMIGIAVVRELSPLITAIVVAGRSGSSYTAQIGVMKITEEIDAMKTMGFNPFRFLVLPRMIALMIAMPLMIFFADLIGIFGGMFIAKLQLNMSYTEFINRLQSVLDSKHVWVGLVKGPFFAALIAAVGCYRGFQVSYNTESIGRYTTISVVNAIFLVIACDAVFSVILTEMGI
jgi:phospholipid/cholesterol/gamma-HCH transport system permease protein